MASAYKKKGENRYTAKFSDAHGGWPTVGGYTDKKATAELARKCERVAALRASGEAIPRELREYLETLDGRIRTRLIKLGLLDAVAAASTTALSVHLKDYKQALYWYTKAAEQGDADAQNMLGLMYANGEGVPKDSVLAYLWWNLAAAQGLKSAKRNLGKIEKIMTREQIAEAQRLSREWKPR